MQFLTKAALSTEPKLQTHTYVFVQEQQSWRQCRKYDPNWNIYYLYKFEIEQSTRANTVQAETIAKTTQSTKVL